MVSSSPRSRSVSPNTPRKLEKDEMQQSADRLSKVTRREITEETLASSRINDVQLKKFFERNYDRTVKKMRGRIDSDNKEVTSLVVKSNPLLGEPKKKRETLSRREEKWIQDMYTKPIKRKDYILANLDRKYQTPTPVMKKLTHEEQDEVGDRLWKKCLERKKRLLVQSEERIYGKPTEPRYLTKEELDTRIAHLYDETLAKHKDKLAKLEEETAFKRKPCKKLNNSDVDAIFTRLMTNGKS